MTEQQQRSLQLMWTILTSVKTADWCIDQLNAENPHAYQNKGDFIRLQKAVTAFMNVVKRRISEQEEKLLNDIVYDNVGLVAEAVAIMSQVPNSQIDWVSEQIFEIAKESINRVNRGE